MGERNDQKVNMLEIGCNEGRSSVWFLQNVLAHEDSRLTVIDTFNDADNYKKSTAKKTPLQKVFEANIKEIDAGKKVFVYKGNSQEVMRTMPTMPRFDIAYIDGSHFVSDVMEDLIYSYRMVKKGGLIICDDYMLGFNGYNDNGYDKWVEKDLPKNAIDAFIRLFYRDVEVVHSDYLMVLRRK